MHKFQTDDRSYSFRKTEESEPFHTKAGAIVEAFEKHARALKVWEVQNPIIFDVCSGIGYNSAAAIQEIRTNKNSSRITVYLFENDLDILNQILDLEDFLEYTDVNQNIQSLDFQNIKNATKNFLENNNPIYFSDKDNLEIIMVFGNFEEKIDFIEQNADFIFYAPFSPKITPDMWTMSQFEKLFSHLKSKGKISTYAYARSVREAMKQSGFELLDGPTIGRRSPSLIGIKN